MIRGEGPVGGPGIRGSHESITGEADGAGAGRERRSHYRRPVQRLEARAGGPATSPYEAWVGGPIAFVQNGDSVTIDGDKKLLTLNVPDAGDPSETPGKWKAPALRVERGVLAKYAKLVRSASEGAVTG